MKSILKSYIRLNTKPLSDGSVGKQELIKQESTEDVPTVKALVQDPFVGRKLSFGDYMQEARVSSGQTIHQVAQLTKIHTHYLEALEREDFGNTPPSIYVKAYIKRLCELYKVDQARAVSLYEMHIGEPENMLPETLVKNLEETKLPNTKQEEKIKQYVKYGSIGLGAVIVLVVILSIILALSKSPVEDKPLTIAQKTQLSSDMEKLVSPQILESVLLKPETNK